MSAALPFEDRLADVELQDLALHLDGADQDPDLVARVLFRVRGGEFFELDPGMSLEV